MQLSSSSGTPSASVSSTNVMVTESLSLAAFGSVTCGSLKLTDLLTTISQENGSPWLGSRVHSTVQASASATAELTLSVGGSVPSPATLHSAAGGADLAP